ncbi:DSBA-like thioredoxin domain [Fusarium albosuccineum]|uniref:DSBA-like thioredoxin domain n=1 Tax=Fusarium albosuccineum TaxID=1237068 RepID=A0A8H4LGY1_9HYPO|nr:DSBA-like thioredoxin domain [Fusarium albosuccineum]
MAIIKIDIFFHFRQLDMAISLYQKTYPGGKSDTFAIFWRPFYLNYGPSTHSVDKQKVADQRLDDMSAEQREKLYKRMNQIGRSAGINFKGGGKIGDTQLAHKLARLGSTLEPRTENFIIEGIFQAHHELEKDITDKQVLLEISVNAGVSAEAVDEYLDSDEEAEHVDQEAKENKEYLPGSGVPTFEIQGERLDGQPDAEDFMAAFIKAREEAH